MRGRVYKVKNFRTIQMARQSEMPSLWVFKDT